MQSEIYDILLHEKSSRHRTNKHYQSTRPMLPVPTFT